MVSAHMKSHHLVAKLEFLEKFHDGYEWRIVMIATNCMLL